MIVQELGELLTRTKLSHLKVKEGILLPNWGDHSKVSPQMQTIPPGVILFSG